MTETNSAVPPNDDGMSPLGFFTQLLAWRRFILLNLVIVTTATAVISLFLPKWYKASATLLPPKQQDIFGTMGASSSVLRNLPGALRLGGGLGQKNSSYNYFAILKSRLAMEAVVKKFDLISVYDVPDSSIELAIKELEGNVSFDETNDDCITLEVLDKDPVRAAAIANYFIQTLNAISIELGTSEARSNRVFIEERLAIARQTLARFEDSLRSYQEKTNLIISPDQASGMSSLASLYALKTKKEIELTILERQATPDNPALQGLKVELDALGKKLLTFPGTGLHSLRLYREVAIQQKIVEFLIPLFEQARIDEQKDIPVILVLDKGVPPEKKFKPKRLVIVASAGLVSLFSSVLVVLGSMYFNRMRNGHQDQVARVGVLLGDWKREIFFWRRSKAGM